MNSPAPAVGPTLETERLSLEPFCADDLDTLHAIFTDAGVRRYLLDDEVMPREWVEAEVIASTIRFEEGGAGLWLARLRDGRRPAGFVGYRPFFDPPELQLIYGFLPAYWGRGLATEAAEAAMAFGIHQLGMTEVRAAVDAPNEDSIAVLERLGMHEWKRTDDGEAGTLFYRVDAGEWGRR